MITTVLAVFEVIILAVLITVNYIIVRRNHTNHG